MEAPQRRYEIQYLLADLFPPLFAFGAGMVALLVFVVSLTYCKRSWKLRSEVLGIGNALVGFLYGGQLTFVHNSDSEEQDQLYVLGLEVLHKSKPKSKCVYCMLISNAIVVTTFLFMILMDLFFVTSSFGCLADNDCYISDNNYYELPVENCTIFIDSTTIKTICYNYNLGFLSALGDAGGVLLIAIIVIVVITKIILRCLKNKWYNKYGYYLQISVLPLLVVGIMVGILVPIYKLELRNLTVLKLVGHGFQYLAVSISLCLTILTPWQLLTNKQEKFPIVFHFNLQDDDLSEDISETLGKAFLYEKGYKAPLSKRSVLVQIERLNLNPVDNASRAGAHEEELLTRYLVHFGRELYRNNYVQHEFKSRLILSRTIEEQI